MRYMRSNVKCDVVFCVVRNCSRSATRMTTSGTSFHPLSLQTLGASTKYKEKRMNIYNFFGNLSSALHSKDI